MNPVKPASFWRGKAIGVVILPGALARMPISGNKLLVVKSFIINIGRIDLSPGELTTGESCDQLSGEKTCYQVPHVNVLTSVTMR